MYKKNLTNKRVIKAMTLGIAAALAVTAPMTDVMAISSLADTNPDDTSAAKAEDAREEKVTAEAKETVAETAKNNAATEEAKIESENVKAEDSSVRDTAVENVKNEADNTIGYANTATGAATDSKDAASKANSATEAAATAGVVEVNEAQEKIAAEAEKLTKMQTEYNTGKAEIEKDAQATSDLVTATIADDGNGNTDILITDSNNQVVKATEAVATEENNAKDALINAQALLEEALQNPTKDEAELADFCNKINAEVEKALDAQYAAEGILDAEIKQYNALVESYNYILVRYGLAGDNNANLCKNYYGKYVIPTVADEDKLDAEALDELLATMQGYTLDQVLLSITGGTETINKLLADIETTKTNVNNAKTYADGAVNAANKAIDYATEAVDSANAAITEAKGKVKDYNDANREEYDNQLNALKTTLEKITTSDAEGKVVENEGKNVLIGSQDGNTEEKYSDSTIGNTEVTYEKSNIKGQFEFRKIEGNLKLVWVETADVKETTTTKDSKTGNFENLKLDNSESMDDAAAMEAAKAAAKDKKPGEWDSKTDTDFNATNVKVTRIADEYSQKIEYQKLDDLSGDDYSATYGSEWYAYRHYFEEAGFSDAYPEGGYWTDSNGKMITTVKARTCDGTYVVLKLDDSCQLKVSQVPSDGIIRVLGTNGNDQGTEKYDQGKINYIGNNSEFKNAIKVYDYQIGADVWRIYDKDGKSWLQCDNVGGVMKKYTCTAKTAPANDCMVSGKLIGKVGNAVNDDMDNYDIKTNKDTLKGQLNASGDVIGIEKYDVIKKDKAEETGHHYTYGFDYSFNRTTSSTTDLGNQEVALTKFNTSEYPDSPSPASYDKEPLTYNETKLNYVDIFASQLLINSDRTLANNDAAKITNIVDIEKKETFQCAQTVTGIQTMLKAAMASALNSIEKTENSIEIINGYVSQSQNVAKWGNFLYTGGDFTKYYKDEDPQANAKVEIPYSITRAFVMQEAGNKQNIEDYGPEFIAPGEMNLTDDTVYYWEIGPDGAPTGKAYTFAELPTAPGSYTFFKGTKFRKDLASPDAPKRLMMKAAPKGPALTPYYILGGELYSYNITLPELPPEGPGGDDPTGDLPTGDLPTGDDTPVVTPVAPAAAPVNQEAVLGARRAAEGPAVLGAKRGLDQAVLGKKRSPETNDSMAIFGWFASLMASLGGTGVTTKALKKSKKKEDDAE